MSLVQVSFDTSFCYLKTVCGSLERGKSPVSGSITISSFGQILIRNGTLTEEGACPIALGCDATWYLFEHVDYFCQLLVKNLICSIAAGGGRWEEESPPGLPWDVCGFISGAAGEGTALLSQSGWLFRLRSRSRGNCSFVLP